MKRRQGGLGYLCALAMTATAITVASCGLNAKAKNQPVLNMFDATANGLPADTVFSIGSPVLNHQGQLMANVSMSSESSPFADWANNALWTGTANDFGMYLQGAAPISSDNGAAFIYYRAFENPDLSDSGNFQFLAQAYDFDTDSPISASRGLWSNRNGEFELRVPTAPIPGGDGSSWFSSLDDPRETHYSNAGYALIRNDRTYTTSEGDPIRNSLWMDTSEGIVNIVKSNDPAPGFPAGYLIDDVYPLDNARSAINSHGEVLFLGTVYDANASPGGPVDTALWQYSNSTLTPIFATRTMAPPKIPVAARPSISRMELSLNNAGQAVIAMPDTADFDFYLHDGIWSNQSGTWENLAYSNQQALGLPIGVNFAHFGDSRQDKYIPAINANGKVAFYAFLKSDDTELVDLTNARTFYSDISGSLQPVFREGDDAPGFSDYLLNAPQGFQMNALDQIAITTRANNKSDQSYFGFVWIMGPRGEVVPVITPGKLINGKEVFQGIIRKNSGGQDGHAREFNDLGQLLYEVTYTDQSKESILHTPDLHYRAEVSSDFDDRYNWTLSTQPAHVHDVFIDPSQAGVTVTGPSEDTVVGNLTIGGREIGQGGSGSVIYRPRAKVPRIGIVLEAIGKLSIHQDAVLDLSLFAATQPELGESLTLFTADEIEGVFGGGIIGADLNSGLVLAPKYQANTIQAVATISADFDMNGQVNIADLIEWAQGFGSPSSMFSQGDANQDGRVNIADLIVWAQHFGQTASNYPAVLSVNAAAVAIPEPTTLALFGILGLMGLARRKSR